MLSFTFNLNFISLPSSKQIQKPLNNSGRHQSWISPNKSKWNRINVGALKCCTKKVSVLMNSFDIAIKTTFESKLIRTYASLTRFQFLWTVLMWHLRLLCFPNDDEHTLQVNGFRFCGHFWYDNQEYLEVQKNATYLTVNFFFPFHELFWCEGQECLYIQMMTNIIGN